MNGDARWVAFGSHILQGAGHFLFFREMPDGAPGYNPAGILRLLSCVVAYRKGLLPDMKRTLLLVGMLFTFALPVRGADWPQWRGPLRDGTVPDAHLPEKWPEKFPAPKWRSYVGVGYSSPVIAGGQAFIMGREKDGMETLLSFDALTGLRL